MNAKDIWQSSDAVCFDVDSTVCTGEGIDDLAEFCGVGKEVSDLTEKAMSNGISFRETLRKRLELIKPSKQKVDEFVRTQPSKLTSGTKELIDKLRSLNKDVYLVSGGFYSIIKPIADELHIQEDHIFTNRLIFAEDGSYCGFDESQPTSSSGGKKIVAQKLKSNGKYKKNVWFGMGCGLSWW
ncbi:uncharacterized protein LOC130624035 isoform X2 [Hydractinia symbiolongicarpus]|uniref:uncharacterized protein LOC130624035 isoform X2 n=1 Tax=Hydractinia symbiolongicarpus TaxID=13093 RepID=UPI00254A582B|nr:uncharacterized protein LOC130624035 isoform X2 [Hydractinia symbiolongicarpus]